MPRLAKLLKFSISATWQAVRFWLDTPDGAPLFHRTTAPSTASVRFWLDTPDGAPVAAVASGKEADLFCFLTMLIEGDAHAAPHHR